MASSLARRRRAVVAGVTVPAKRGAWGGGLVARAVAARGVSLGGEGRPQVPVLDGESDQAVRPAGDVPGQRPPSSRTRRVQRICVAILPGRSGCGSFALLAARS